jgi:acetyl esterase/lipase
MSLRRLTLITTLSSVVLHCAAGLPARADDGAGTPAPIRLWAGAAPGSDAQHWPSADYHEEWETPGEILRGVTDPTIQVFLPEPVVNTGAAVVICPGGGYRNLWINKEGWKVAREMQKRGIAGIVLKYRYYDRFAAIQDAHRAVRTVRSRAREWHIDEHAIGVGGFSAGGHLTLNMAAQLGRPEGWTPDEVDRLSKRPDFLMPIYPSVQLMDGAVVNSSFPPVFLAIAADDDKMKPLDILPFIGRLHDLGVPVELHLYQGGGHGFGIGTPACGCSSWLDLFRDWLKTRGLLRGK